MSCGDATAHAGHGQSIASPGSRTGRSSVITADEDAICSTASPALAYLHNLRTLTADL
ncbi:hypothetical protein BH23ACT9_BH23ACT9_01580 [soil metagenome]